METEFLVVPKDNQNLREIKTGKKILGTVEIFRNKLNIIRGKYETQNFLDFSQLLPRIS